MENLFVSYEIAKKLKEKGFNEICFAFFHPTDKTFIKARWDNEASNNDWFILAPMYQQVVDWLRDEHLIHVTVLCEEWLDKFAGRLENEDGFVETADYNDYYVAFDEILKEALNLIKK